MTFCLVLTACSGANEQSASSRIENADVPVSGELGSPKFDSTEAAAQPSSAQQGESSPSPRPRNRECPKGSICFFDLNSFNGRRLALKAPVAIADLRDLQVDGEGFDETISSVINDSDYDLVMWSTASLGGGRRDVPKNTRIQDMGAQSFDDLTSSISATGADCN
ncbi:peptidase inhibitor family I36 protein [Streptomyces sp. NPDC055210]